MEVDMMTKLSIILYIVVFLIAVIHHVYSGDRICGVQYDHVGSDNISIFHIDWNGCQTRPQGGHFRAGGHLTFRPFSVFTGVDT